MQIPALAVPTVGTALENVVVVQEAVQKGRDGGVVAKQLAPVVHWAVRCEDESRTLLHELFPAAADIDVTQDELCVTVHPLSSPHRTYAVQALCDTLTETETFFPGSWLKLRFAIRPRPPIGLAFPGPSPKRISPVAYPSPGK